LTAIRRPALLRQLFAFCASAPASIISLQKLQGQLQDAGAIETIAHYLQVLEDAFLVAALEKYAVRAGRRRAAPPKLITLSNAFLAASDPRGIPEQTAEPERFGMWVENACLAYAWNAGQRVTYWREEPFEVDAIFDGSWGQWAVEVKTGVWTARDLAGLLEFTRRYPAYRPLVVCEAAAMTGAKRVGIDAVRWQDFLVSGIASLGLR
jgi:predicted AAA+ superfamily ATPase